MDEMTYIASGFLPSTLDDQYLTARRTGRGFPFDRRQRELLLSLHRSLNQWMARADGSGVVDLPTALGRMVELGIGEDRLYREWLARRKVEHILLDEFHLLGNVEWRFVLSLLADPAGRNALWCAGDTWQARLPIRFEPSEAFIVERRSDPLSFAGRSDVLKVTYRMTKQSEAAAARMWEVWPKARPVSMEVELDGLSSSTSPIEGAPPVIIHCTFEGQQAEGTRALRRVGDQRTIGVLTLRDDEEDIEVCANIARAVAGDDEAVDHVQLRGGGRHHRIAYGSVNGASGCEFDVILLVNFTLVPRSTTPEDERWRDVSLAYVAISRARELAILLCPGEPAGAQTVVGELLRSPAVAEVAVPDDLIGLLRRLGFTA